MHIFHNNSKEAGDTIVEVIIAIAVIATILSGAFMVTHHSAQSVRDAEEHAEALQYLQGQVELLRAAAGHSGGLPKNLSQAFCLVGNQHYLAGSTQCKFGSFYDVAISSPTSVPIPNTSTTFNFVDSWPAISGGTDTVYLAYKVLVIP